MRTLMCEPLALFYQLRLQRQRCEVATRDETRMLFTKEEWCLAGRDLIDLVGRLIVRHSGGE